MRDAANLVILLYCSVFLFCIEWHPFDAICWLLTRVGSRREATDPKAGRKRRLKGINMIMWLARPINKEQENNTDKSRCEVTSYSRCHDAAGSVQRKSNFFFILKSHQDTFKTQHIWLLFVGFHSGSNIAGSILNQTSPGLCRAAAVVVSETCSSPPFLCVSWIFRRSKHASPPHRWGN